MSTRYPRFRKAMEAHKTSLASGTYWRYQQGKLPSFGRLITEDPNLAMALAEDAAELAAKRKEVVEPIVEGEDPNQ